MKELINNLIKGLAVYFGITFLSMRKLKVTVITGTGRVGTNFFATFFNAIHNNIYAVHEPSPDLNSIGIDKTKGEILKSDIIKYISKKRKFQLAKMHIEKKNHYVECNPFLYQLLDEYKTVFPKTKIVIIIRDPRTFVQSGLNKSPTADGKTFFYDNFDESKRLVPNKNNSDLYVKDWENYSRIQKISWYWNQANKKLYDYYLENSDHTILLRFENIFSKNIEKRKTEYKKMLKFLDLDYDEKLLNKLIKVSKKKRNKTKSEVWGEFKEWSEEEKKQLLDLTQPMRTIFNY